MDLKTYLFNKTFVIFQCKERERKREREIMRERERERGEGEREAEGIYREKGETCAERRSITPTNLENENSMC